MTIEQMTEQPIDGLTLHSELQHILHQQAVTSVYQPIISLKDGTVFGYEALTRGPEGSPLQSPLKLFAAAESKGLLYPLDRLARAKAIQGALTRTEEEMLFLNLSAEILNDPQFEPGRTLELLEQRGLTPGNVVFEITERSSIEDFDAAKSILDHYRQQGYRIAIDDAGAGYSSLQAIAELQPDFIKIDRSLIKDIHRHKTKEYILETMLSFAEKLGIHLIAEGIESAEELMKLTRMGVHFGQGFLLGRPGTEQAQLQPELKNYILLHRKFVETAGSFWAIGDLSIPYPSFENSTPISTVAGYFKKNANALGVAVVSDGVPIGLIMRDRLFQQLAGQYGYSLFWNRPIDQVMDTSPLIVDEQMSVEEVSQLATSRDIQNLYDLVIITSKGRMLGMSSIRSILECITNARMESAKVSNPLTGLPGNLQIYRELSKRLTDKKPFSVIYADLDYFKWFNDRYGFQKGDQLIQFTADCIQQAMGVLGLPFDFVGHIGGDDFIAITASEEPEKLCGEILRRFDAGVKMFYNEDDWTYVEDRQGNRIDSDGVTLSLSLVVCKAAAAVTPEQISETAAKLKKQSKAHRGSVFSSDAVGVPEDDGPLEI
ncbi:GGDEF domain-containing protein [Paenibacillus elgii]|uniref:GGDEF domain-containing protein n=1 Tax=Paenibacillus elgii TaxID=189691 RepID=UPI0020421FA1|nr:GGDEF domain-containing protein [Paenibacillus elgii]MCM3270197.1 GGDEF domain-containing protein [Paenibacillus elgii]